MSEEIDRKTGEAQLRLSLSEAQAQRRIKDILKRHCGDGVVWHYGFWGGWRDGKLIVEVLANRQQAGRVNITTTPCTGTETDVTITWDIIAELDGRMRQVISEIEPKLERHGTQVEASARRGAPKLEERDDWPAKLKRLEAIEARVKKGVPVSVACRLEGIAKSTYYDWEKKRRKIRESIN